MRSQNWSSSYQRRAAPTVECVMRVCFNTFSLPTLWGKTVVMGACGCHPIIMGDYYSNELFRVCVCVWFFSRVRSRESRLAAPHGFELNSELASNPMTCGTCVSATHYSIHNQLDLQEESSFYLLKQQRATVVLLGVAFLRIVVIIVFSGSQRILQG
jgi:hypothetical protein